MALLFKHGAKVTAPDRWGHTALDEGRVASGASAALMDELSRRAEREDRFGAEPPAVRREGRGPREDSARQGAEDRGEGGGDASLSRSLSRLASMRRHHSDASLAECAGEGAPADMGIGPSPFAAAAAAFEGGEEGARDPCAARADSLHGASSGGSGEVGGGAAAVAKVRRREEALRLLPEVPEAHSGELSGGAMSHSVTPRRRSGSSS